MGPISRGDKNILRNKFKYSLNKKKVSDRDEYSPAYVSIVAHN
jgi:hypothetical protein